MSTSSSGQEFSLLKKVSRNSVFASVLLFVDSLFFTAVRATNGQTLESTSLLLMGWFGFFMGEPQAFSWLANPFLFFAWYYGIKGSPRTALLMSAIAFLLAALFLLTENVMLNESGFSYPVESFKAGYWLWLLSSGVPAVAIFGGFLREK